MIEFLTLNLFDLPIFNGSVGALEQVLQEVLDEHSVVPQPFVLFTPNPEQIVLAEERFSFRKNLQRADLLLPDGTGLLWASRLLSMKRHSPSLKARISGVQVVESLLKKYPDLRYFVLGGKEYPHHFSVGKAKLESREGYKKVRSPSEDEEQEVTHLLLKQKPEIVFVAFGAPDQEAWVVSHVELLKKAQVKLVMVVGGTFDELLGKVPRTPQVIDAIGLKWFHRLLTQPWRWRRQLRLVTFVKMTLKELFL